MFVSIPRFIDLSIVLYPVIRQYAETFCPSEREREMFYLTTQSTHFIYGYMASDIIWLRTILIVRKETRCRHIGYSYRLTARVLLYAPSHRQDNTYHGLCYTRPVVDFAHHVIRTPGHETATVVVMWGYVSKMFLFVVHWPYTMC